MIRKVLKNALIKRIMLKLSMSSGFLMLLNCLFKNKNDFLAVITYHRIIEKHSAFAGVDIDTFRQQICELSKNWNIVSEEQVVAFYMQQSSLPERAVLVTFDDGFIENHTHAAAILNEFNTPSLTFLPSECIETTGSIWTDHIADAFQITTMKTLILSFFTDAMELENFEQREIASVRVKRFLKHVTNKERKAYLKELFQKLNVNPADFPRRLLTITQVKSMVDDKTKMGGHSATHPILSQIPTDELAEEVEQCKAFLEDKLSCEAKSFCYPNGQPQDFNSDVVDAVQRAGFLIAFTTIEGINLDKEFRYEIRRIAAPKDNANSISFVLLDKYIKAKVLSITKNFRHLGRKVIGNCFCIANKILRKRNSVRILMYHRVCDLYGYDQLAVSVGQFKKQMEYLKSKYKVIDIDRALELIESKQLDQNYIVITFDDGYLDTLVNALPVLEALQLPACMFITSNFCQGGVHPRYDFNGQASQMHLNWSQVETLAKNPLVTIGSHTVSHPHLQRISPNQLRAEIVSSKQLIEEKTGTTVNFFCAPNGDYGLREIALIHDAGYKAAVTVSPGVNVEEQNVFELLRTEVTDRDSLDMFKIKLEGAFDIIHKLIDIRRRKRFDQLRYSGDKN